MRYLFLFCCLLLLPFKAFAWEVVGSGGATGPSLGPEKIANYSFDSGTTGWTIGSGWTVSGGDAIASSSSFGNLTQNFASMISPLVIGHNYQVEFSKEFNNDTLKVGSLAGTGRCYSDVGIPTAAGTYTCQFTATDATFAFINGSGVLTTTIHYVSCKELL